MCRRFAGNTRATLGRAISVVEAVFTEQALGLEPDVTDRAIADGLAFDGDHRSDFLA